MEQVTSNQVKEMIDQLAAMTAAASITPEIVASIFEKMRNLNDQEREKVIKVATEYIEEIKETGVDADKCRTRNESNVQADLDNLNQNVNMLGIEMESLSNRKLDVKVVSKNGINYISISMGTSAPTEYGTSAILGKAICGYAICGTN